MSSRLMLGYYMAQLFIKRSTPMEAKFWVNDDTRYARATNSVEAAQAAANDGFREVTEPEWNEFRAQTRNVWPSLFSKKGSR